MGHELPGQTSSNVPWAHSSHGYLQPELNSATILEAGSGIVQGKPLRSVGDSDSHHGLRPATASETTSAVATCASQSLQASNSIVNDSELAEEADVVVQELGLISVRKRALTSQAQAVGRSPAEMESRKGEEWRELLAREERVRGRLDEIERQRNLLRAADRST
jgi:hypothetical protein